MEAERHDNPREEAALLQAMVMLASVTTAASVYHAGLERRAGRDPSGQEAEAPVRHYLETALPDLQADLMRLTAGAMQAAKGEEGRIAAAVRHFDALLVLRRVNGTLHTMHQRLLSLYPAVSEYVIEEVREVHGASRGLLDVDGARYLQKIPPFLRSAFDLSTQIRLELAGL